MKTTLCFTLTPLTFVTLALGPNCLASENHNVMLHVQYVEKDRMPFSSLSHTLDIQLRESEVLKFYEVVIWESTSSVHFYALPNDFDSWYGFIPAGPPDEDGTQGYWINDNITDADKIAYREQYLVSKYTDMPMRWTHERSTFLKEAFIDIGSYMVNQHPGSDHHLKYIGHGGPGGALFAGQLYKDEANAFLNAWTQALGKPLGVIDMGGPCNKGSFAELDNFCEYTNYYVASDLLNGGFTFDDFTWTKHRETKPLSQYHNLFAAYQSLEEVLIARIDLRRRAYEYSRNNMINNQVDQANYLYSCDAFRQFSPNFKTFLGSVRVDYFLFQDLYQYMIDNEAPQTLIDQFNDVIVYKVDNKDFFEWGASRNGMLMPHPDLLKSIITAARIPKIIISEMMVASNDGRLPQWIELYNPSNAYEINLKDWTLEIQNSQSADFNGRLFVTLSFSFKERTIKPQDTLLIVSKRGQSSNNFLQDQVYDLNTQLPHLQGIVLSEEGFYLKLSDNGDGLVDEVGNLNSSRSANNKIAWVLPKSVTGDGERTSMIRRYDDAVPRLGTEQVGWVSAQNTKLLTGTIHYYGHPRDIGAPGIKSGSALPVQLSKFRAELTDAGVILKWATESEVDNAGFYIMRSKTKNGIFKAVNPTLIQGAGTTSERHTYTWKDTTAKPNTIYYYRIEDISHAGVREQLATVRLRGLVSASGKLTTRWADLKRHE